MIYLNNRILDLYLIPKCYKIVIIWGEIGRNWRWRRKSLYLQNSIMENNNKNKKRTPEKKGRSVVDSVPELEFQILKILRK